MLNLMQLKLNFAQFQAKKYRASFSKSHNPPNKDMGCLIYPYWQWLPCK